jgi:DNA-directed RNA polymerase specialized sigma24 family protein
MKRGKSILDAERDGNYKTGESFTGERDFFSIYMANLKSIPPMSSDEERELLTRWELFQDEKARERIITAHMPLVPPIARSTCRRFQFNVWQNLPELVAEGNFAVVKAFEAFPPRSNSRFQNYARRSIRNATNRCAVSLLSVVHRPWGERVTSDVYIDPMLPDVIGVEESTGCYRAHETQRDDAKASASNFAPMRSGASAHPPPETIELPWILQAQLAGLKLKVIAQQLDVSISTAHRRAKAAIEEVRHHA